MHDLDCSTISRAGAHPIRAVVHGDALERWAVARARQLRGSTSGLPGWVGDPASAARATFAVIIPAVHSLQPVLVVTTQRHRPPILWRPA